MKFNDDFSTGLLATNEFGTKWTSTASVHVINGEVYFPFDPSLTGDLGQFQSLWLNHGQASDAVEIEFTITKPANYKCSAGGRTNKLFAVYCDGYSQKGSGSTVWLVTTDSINPDDGKLQYIYTTGGFTSSSFVADGEGILFEANGVEEQITINIVCKLETYTGAKDGSLHVRVSKNQSAYSDVIKVNNLPIRKDDNNQGFRSSHYLNWQQLYTETTIFKLSNYSLNTDLNSLTNSSVSEPIPAMSTTPLSIAEDSTLIVDEKLNPIIINGEVQYFPVGTICKGAMSTLDTRYYALFPGSKIYLRCFS